MCIRTRSKKSSSLWKFQDSDDWANHQCCIRNLGLQVIMNLVQEVKASFDSILFTHVYQEFNSHADKLSKEALILQEGNLLEEVFRERNLY